MEVSNLWRGHFLLSIPCFFVYVSGCNECSCRHLLGVEPESHVAWRVLALWDCAYTDVSRKECVECHPYYGLLTRNGLALENIVKAGLIL